MTVDEKLHLLEEMLELGQGTLTSEAVLADIRTWDSMAVLSLIALMDDRFSKSLTGNQIAGFVTVQHILDVMH